MNRTAAYLAVLLALALGSVACSKAPAAAGEDATTGSDAAGGTIIGAAGGSFTSADGGVVVTVPAGALSADTALSATLLAAAPQGTVGTAFDLGPTGTTFNVPVTVTFKYAEANLAGKSASTLRTATWANSAWILLAGQQVDTTAQTVTGTTTHFSPFAVIFAPTGGDDVTADTTTDADGEDAEVGGSDAADASEDATGTAIDAVAEPDGGGALDVSADGGGSMDALLPECATATDCKASKGEPATCAVWTCGADQKCATAPAADGVSCDDANACTSNDSCAAGLCAGATTTCDDLNPCTNNSCDPKSGCAYANNTATCDDGNACTSGDACAVGLCSGMTLSCDDGNVCTDDSCAVKTGCVHTSNAKCDDGNACTTDTCDAKTGCKNTNNTAACSDGDSCTSGDQCASGACVSGVPFYFEATETGGTTSGLNAVVNIGGAALAAGWKADDANSPVKDVWLLSTGKGGAVQWSKSYGGSADDVANAVVGVLQPGDQIAAAFAGLTMSKGAGDADGWVGMTDSQGALQWDVTFGGKGYDAANAMVANTAGLAVAGVTTQVSGSNGWDATLIQYDTAGNLLWSQTYGGTGIDTAAAVVSVKDGLTFAGSTTSKGKGQKDAWLVHTDKNGAVLWETTFGGAGDDVASGLIAAPFVQPPGYFLAGSKTVNAHTTMWLIRTDINGKLLWERTFYGAPDSAYASGLTLLSSAGQLKLVGHHYLPSGKSVPVVVTTDSQGNASGFKEFGTPGYNDNLFAAINGSAIAGQRDGVTVGATDGWLLNVDDFVHSSCAQVGVCMQFQANDCDDGAGCTLDTCDPVKACISQNSPDGTTCDADSNPCTQDDMCAGGKCVPGLPILPEQLFPSTNQAAGMTPTQNGFAIVGTSTPNPPNSGNKADLWVMQTDATGAKVWDATFGGPDNDYGNAIAVASDGSLAVAGQTTLNAANAGWIVGTDSTGKKQWEATVTPTSAGMASYLWSVVARPGGGFMAAGSLGNDAVLLSVDATGAVLGQKSYVSPSATARAFSIANDPNGGYVIVGDYGSPNHGWIAHADSTGNSTWSIGQPCTSTVCTLRSVVAFNNSYVAVGDIAEAGGAYLDAWLVGFDTGGNLVWQKTIPLQSVMNIAASVLVPYAGGYAIGASSQINGLNKGALILTDTAGNLLANYPTESPYGVIGIVAHGVAIGANSGFTLADIGGLYGADAWGNFGCAASGACALGTGTDCDDKNPCTSDGCSPSTGCTHTTLTDGTSCGIAKTCTSGVCGP